MAQPVVMPKLGQTVEESTIVRWLKKEGDKVFKGDILLEIETDKAVLEVESFLEGTVLKIVKPEGEVVPVMETVAFIGEPGEAIPETKQAPARKEKAPPRTEQKESRPTAAQFERPETARPQVVPPPPEPVTGEPENLGPATFPGPNTGFFRISPRAAKLAREKVINARPIRGSGPNGRVIERDVEAHLEAHGYSRIRISPAAKILAAREGIDLLALQADDDFDRISVTDVERAISEKPKPLSRIRRIIAKRLTESFTTTPHFFVTVSVEMSPLLSLRSEWQAEGIDLSVNDFLIKAAALTLPEFPAVNSSTQDGKNVRWNSRVHLGIAVAVAEGLVVPVIRDADRLDLRRIHARSTELVTRARTGKLEPSEMGGSTFTISNMGMMDIENFTAIINPGESAILAVSSVRKVPVVREGQILIGSMMKMTLSSDHRLIDGVLAARFVNGVKDRLEERALWQRLI